MGLPELVVSWTSRLFLPLEVLRDPRMPRRRESSGLSPITSTVVSVVLVLFRLNTLARLRALWMLHVLHVLATLFTPLLTLLLENVFMSISLNFSFELRLRSNLGGGLFIIVS